MAICTELFQTSYYIHMYAYLVFYRSVLLESIASDMGMLKQLEDKTLDLLQKSEGTSLSQSRILSIDVKDFDATLLC